MKKNVTKKSVIELATLIRNKGYWSIEVRNYLEQFEFSARMNLDCKAKYYEREILGN